MTWARRRWAKLGRAGTVLLWAAAAVATVLALGLVVVAVDVLRTPNQITADDTRFQTSPQRQAGLWDWGFLPGDVTETVLGLEDDVDYRRVVGLYVLAEPGKVNYQGFPELESRRAKAQFELTHLSRTDPDLARRSKLLTLYGVMTLDGRPLDNTERDTMLQAAVSSFRAAIDLERGNEDAKTNLETVLRVFGPVALPANSPSGGANQGNTSGQGNTGTGY
jgi:hypothetical protein